jgi:4-hydroxybenzoate polyprenyltransferase
MTFGVALRLGRISNLPTVWTNVLAGTALAGGVLDTRLVLAALALSLFYVAGMYLNDAFDRVLDAKERPSRPIPSGQVSASVVFTMGLLMLLLGLGLLTYIGVASGEPGTAWYAPLAGVALAAAIVGYDAWHKANPLSPVLMGLCRVLVYVTAGLLIASPLPVGVFIAAGMAFCYLIGLTYVAKHETLGGIETLWPLLLLAAPLVYGLATAVMGGTGLIVCVLFVGWVGYALSFLMLPGRTDLPRAVVSLIAGISLLDAMLIAGHGQADLAWIAVAGFAFTVFLQRLVPGT